MQEDSNHTSFASKTLFLCLLAIFALGISFFSFTDWPAQNARTNDSKTTQESALAQFSSWVLFGNRAAEGASFLAYGFLSEVKALPRKSSQPETESSAILTFVIEGTVVDIRQHPPALLIKSQGTLRFFFDPQAKRNFTKPESFRSGKEVAKYDVQRRVLFEPTGGWLLDSSVAQLVASHNFTVNNIEQNLARLWGSQLMLQSRAHAGNGLPSPLPQFSGAIPYSGKLLTDGEQTKRQLPRFVFPASFTATHLNSSVHEQSWD